MGRGRRATHSDTTSVSLLHSVLAPVFLDRSPLALAALLQVALPAALVRLQPLDDRLRDEKVAIPFLVGGGDLPQLPLPCTTAQRLRKSLLLIVPIPPLLPVGHDPPPR